jgi:group II intron reverse transcriptase/maturase
MRSAETILITIRDRGKGGKPLERIYRLLFNRELYLLAYSRIHRNAGALTPGVTQETADGMSLDTIERIIELLRFERYHWSPSKRISIAKPHSKKRRPLGLPSWSDKLVQEVIRLILDAYYEPHFSEHSHGFRPGRGCHSALQEIRHTWVGTTWYLHGDISGCFERLEHELLLGILAERIHDGRFLRLIGGALRAGYLEEWTWHPTLSGTPQGGIASPVLSNLYLDRLDQFVETRVLPAHNRGVRRQENPAYRRLMHQARIRERHGDHKGGQELRRQAQHLPSSDPSDPAYRRLRYIRYADDVLLGFAGPRSEAEEIKREIGAFLWEELKLELSEEKTVITHGRTGAAHFLGYDITTLHNDRKQTRGHRSINGGIGFQIPEAVIQEKGARYSRRGKPVHRPELLQDSVFAIVTRYQQEYRGIVGYYRLAYNLHRLSRLRWVMEQSLVKTLAHKLQITVRQVYRRYSATVQTEDVPRKVLRVVIEREGRAPLIAQWGAISLAWNDCARPTDPTPSNWSSRTDLLDRLLADTCELCGSQEDVQVHHIRHLKTLHQPGRRAKPRWMQVMAARQRKTLVVCHSCHREIHAGQPHHITNPDTGELSAAKVARSVRRGAEGKVPL